MKKKYFFLAITFIMVNSAIQISCNKGGSSYNTPTPPPAANTGTEISMYNMAFSPASKTVAHGTVVTWKNGDSYPHTVTSNDGTSFDSGSINGGGTFSYTASTPGTFDYHCTIHGISMSGTLIVSP